MYEFLYVGECKNRAVLKGKKPPQNYTAAFYCLHRGNHHSIHFIKPKKKPFQNWYAKQVIFTIWTSTKKYNLFMIFALNLSHGIDRNQREKWFKQWIEFSHCGDNLIWMRLIQITYEWINFSDISYTNSPQIRIFQNLSIKCDRRGKQSPEMVSLKAISKRKLITVKR